MYFITTKRMLEVCFFQHTPTFIIEPIFFTAERFYKVLKYCTGTSLVSHTPFTDK